MAEVLRELVVQLSLSADNYTRNMKSIAAQVKQAEAVFKNAGAGIKNFEKSLDGMRAKSAQLTQTTQLQNLAVDQAAKRLAVANQKVQEAKGYYAEYVNKLKAARAAQATFNSAGVSTSTLITREQNAIKLINQQLEEYQKKREKGLVLTDKEAKNEAFLIEQREKSMADLKRYTAASADGIKLLEGQVESERKMIQNAQDEAARASTAFQNAQAQLKEMVAEQKRLAQEIATQETTWWKAGQALEDFAAKAEKVGKRASEVGKFLSKTVTAPIVALGTAAVKSSISYESAFTNVRKTVDATEEEYSKLSDSILKMSTQIGASAEEIASVMSTAGQLGIHNEDLVEFTKTMVDLSNAAEDLDADTAATQAAKFANIMQMDQSKFANLGAAVTDLGNNFATTEGAILEMAMRMAGAGKQVGLTEAQVLGFATTLSSVGIEAQMGGSALSKALVKMEVAAETGGQALTDFAKVSGMTEKEFQKLWKSSPADAFQAFIVGLAKIDEKGQSTIKTLSDIGINEIRLRDTILRTTNANELMSRAQETANRAWKQNTALTNEVNKRYGTTEYKLKNLKNSATNLLRTVGNDLNPTLQTIIQTAQGYIEQLAGMDEGHRKSIETWAGLTAAAGPAVLVFGKLTTAASKVAKPVATALKHVGAFSATLKGIDGGLLTKLKGAFDALPTVAKVGGVVALTTAIVAGTAALIDYASGAKAAREAIEQMDSTAQEWENNQADTFYRRGGLANLGLTMEDFKEKYRDVGKWYNSFIADVNDGEKETSETIKKWRDSYTEMNKEVRAALNARRDEAKKNGATSLVKDIDKDFERVKKLNSLISSLLGKAKNRDLTKREMEILQGYLNEQHAIEVKYKLVPEDGSKDGGYEAIRKKIEAEERRRRLLGYTDEDKNGLASADFYQSTIVATMEAYKGINDQIDAEYDTQYASLKRTLDLTKAGTKEHEDALKRIKALDEQYAKDRQANYEKYAQTLVKPFEGLKKQGSLNNWLLGNEKEGKVGWLDQLDKILKNPNKNEGLKQLAEFTESIKGEEGSLTEVVTLLSQMKEIQATLGGEKFSKLFGDFDPSKYLDMFAGLTASLEGVEGAEGLYEMFKKSLPQEVMDLATQFGFDNITKAFEDFKTQNDFVIDVKVQNITKEDGTPFKVDDQTISAYIAKFKAGQKDGSDPDHSDVIAWLEGNPLEGYVWKFNADRRNGNDPTATLRGDLSGLTALVIGFLTDPEVSDADLVKNLTPPEVEALIKGFAEKTGLVLNVDDVHPTVTAIIAALKKDPNTNIYDLSDDEKLWVYAVLKELDVGLADDWAEKNKIDVKANPIPKVDIEDKVIRGLKGFLSELDASEAPPVKIRGVLTSYEVEAINAYTSQGHSFAGQTTVKRSKTTLKDLINGGNAIVIDAKGNEVQVTADNVESVVGGEDAIIGTNEKLQTVIVAQTVPEVTKTAVEAATEALNENRAVQRWNQDNAHWGSDLSQMGPVEAFFERAMRWADTTPFGGVRNRDIPENEQREVAKGVAAIADFVHGGGDVSQATAEAFKQGVQLLVNSSVVPDQTGRFVNDTARKETVQNLRSMGYNVTDETLNSFLQNLYQQVTDKLAQSAAESVEETEPAVDAQAFLERMGFTFTDDEGMTAEEMAFMIFGPDWQTLATESGTELGEEVMDSTGEAVTDSNLSTPVSNKVNEAGKDGAVTARAAGGYMADGIVDGFKEELEKRRNEIEIAVASLNRAVKVSQEIASPSRVWKREIGAQMAAGLRIGLTEGLERDTPVIRNAMNYLTRDSIRTAGASLTAMKSAISGVMSSMYLRTPAVNKTYNANSNLNVQNMYMGNEMDAQALAEEMAAINRRVHRGYGSY